MVIQGDTIMQNNTSPKTNLDKNNCQFCDLAAKNVYSFVLSTAPDDPEEFTHHDYFREAIYTCDKHTLECKGFTLNGEELG